MKATGSTDQDNRYLINTTQSDNETLVPSGNGWSIANESFTFQDSWLPNPTVAYRVAVVATPNPSLTPNDISATTASLASPGTWATGR